MIESVKFNPVYNESNSEYSVTYKESEQITPKLDENNEYFEPKFDSVIFINTGDVSKEDIEKAINDYFEENPVQSASRIGEITLLADAWEGSSSLYSQIVDIEGITENSQVDLTPSVEQLLVFYEKDVTFVTENENGIVKVYAIGQKPQNDYSIQVTITEVGYE